MLVRGRRVGQCYTAHRQTETRVHPSVDNFKDSKKHGQILFTRTVHKEAHRKRGMYIHVRVCVHTELERSVDVGGTRITQKHSTLKTHPTLVNT